MYLSYPLRLAFQRFAGQLTIQLLYLCTKNKVDVVVVGRILDILRAFLIKQLLHSRLLYLR